MEFTNRIIKYLISNSRKFKICNSFHHNCWLNVYTGTVSNLLVYALMYATAGHMDTFETLEDRIEMIVLLEKNAKNLIKFYEI